MARIFRFTYPNAYYHIMNRGNKGSGIFIRDNDYKRYIELLGQYAEQYRIKILAYCLMPNHIHLLIQDPFEFVSLFMKVFHSRYAQYLNKKEENRGHIFLNCWIVLKEQELSCDRRLINILKNSNRI